MGLQLLQVQRKFYRKIAIEKYINLYESTFIEKYESSNFIGGYGTRIRDVADDITKL